MPVYKIADIIADIRPHFSLFETLANNYTYFGTEPVQLKLSVRENYVKEQALKNPHLSEGELECVFLSDLFNKKILKFNAIFLHSSAILYKGKAYLFSAESGVGKSTHTKLWIEKFGNDNVQIINDDMPIIRFIDDEWYVYGSPFDGGTGINKNIRAKLGGIVFLERAEENNIKTLDKNDVFTRIYKNTIKFSLNGEYAEYMMSTANKLINDNKFYLLKCNTDISSAEMCEKYLINGDGYEKAEKNT